MSDDYSSDGLLSFLREATVAGRLHPATARSRRKAADALFDYLEEAERADLRNLDLAVLAARIHEAPKDDLRGELVELYAQRLAEALDDYLGSDVATAFSGSTRSNGAAARAMNTGTAEERALESVRLSFDRYKSDVIPIPLERGRVVYIHDMPTDLSANEARKIARVVQAFATDEEPGS